MCVCVCVCVRGAVVRVSVCVVCVCRDYLGVKWVVALVQDIELNEHGEFMARGEISM